MTKIYIKIENVILLIIFLIGFVRFPYSVFYNDLRVLLASCVLLYVAYNFKYLKKDYLLLDFTTLIFGMWVLLSGYICKNNVSMSNPFKGATFFVLALLSIFLGMQVIKEKRGIDHVIKVFTYCAGILALIVDITVITKIGIRTVGGAIGYIVGSKFAVMYLHIIVLALICMYMEDGKKKLKILMLYTVYVIGIALLVDCVTGIVGTLFFDLIIYIFRKYPYILLKPSVALFAEILAFSYVFFGTFVMSNEYVLNFITNYMGGAETMLSRVAIYEMVLLIIPLSPVWGYGYTTTYELGIKIGGFADTQNSLLEWMWQAGIPSAVMILVIIVLAFVYINKNYKRTQILNIYSIALFYTYIFLGSIEILMELPFFSVLSLAVIVSDKVLTSEEKVNA